MSRDPTKYFENKKVVNFDIVHYECCGDPLIGSDKNYKTISYNDVKEYPKLEKKESLGDVFRNVNRKDVWVEKNVVLNYSKSCFLLEKMVFVLLIVFFNFVNR